MTNSPGDVAWVIDTALGHLAVAHRAGWLESKLGIPTRHFLQVADAYSELSLSDERPRAVLIGYCRRGDAVKLLHHSALRTIPTIISDTHSDWPTADLPPSAHYGGRSFSALDELEKWAAANFGSSQQ